MKPRSILFIAIMTGAAVSLLSPPSGAEFYKYRDANGVIRYTDNIANVPPDQRPKVKSYAGPEDFATPARKGQERAKSPSPSSVQNAPEDETKEPETPEQRSARLKEQKAILEAEYNEIVKTQKALTEKRKTIQSPASYQSFNEHQQRLKERAEAYETRRRRFEEKVKEYNQSLENGQHIQE